MNHTLVIQEVKQRWESQRLKFGNKISDEELQRFEIENNVVLPKDFREYLIELNGMIDCSSDDDFMSFHSLDKIRLCDFTDHKYQVLSKNFYIFADFSINLFLYAIELSPIVSATNNVCLIGGDAPFLIAQSFTDFLKMYLAGEAANY
jgi:hypothetical protein